MAMIVADSTASPTLIICPLQAVGSFGDHGAEFQSIRRGGGEGVVGLDVKLIVNGHDNFPCYWFLVIPV